MSKPRRPLDDERKVIVERLAVMQPVSQLATVLGLVFAAAKHLVAEIVKEETRSGRPAAQV